MSRKELEKDGSITVHNRELYTELLGKPSENNNVDFDEDELNHPESTLVSPAPRHYYGTSPSRVPSRSSTAQMTRIEDWLSRKARRAVVSLPDDPQLIALKQYCQTISKKEKEFLAELDLFISLEEEKQQYKKEILYKNWCERVFLPVQAKLASQIASDEYHTFGIEKRCLFDQYLSYRNKKQVFLDTIIPNEYNPLQIGKSRSLQVHTGVLDDPLIAQRTDYREEQMILNGCDQEISLQQSTSGSCNGREDTDPVQWLTMQLVHIDSEIRQRSKNRMHCDHNYESAKQEGSEKELNIPHKRTVYYSRPQLKLTWIEETSANTDNA